MKRTSASQSAFFNPRLWIAFVFCATGALLVLGGSGVYSSEPTAAKGTKQTQSVSGTAETVTLSKPVSQDQDLRALPYIAPNVEIEERRLMRHPLPQTPSPKKSDPIQLIRRSAQPAAMPTPIASFDGMSSVQSGCGCLPPDTDGDVGPNHYIQSVNSSIKIFDKSGNPLNGVNGTTYNTFFSAMGASTPCGAGQNDGDGFVFYDQIADRWVVSDFAFPSDNAVNYQCIGVSKTNDPVSGGWWLYALQIDPANPGWLGDYPKFGLWPDAYYLSVNLFDQASAFQGVRVFALPRSAMINGTGAPNSGAVSFLITPATLGDAYSLVPATFRTGTAPAPGTAEYFMAINSSANAGTVENQVFTWRFSVDFVTPANSTFGLGANHAPNGAVTVNGFVDAFTSTSSLIVPQTGTTALLDTLGDKIMTPLVYQKLGGTESLWASHTVNNNQNGTGPTAIRWYQFNVTGGAIPATPAQQQTFNNGADGLWRWMPSIAVDGQGNMAINYSVSSGTTNPAINYAGRLAGDPLNSLAQGETLLIQGAGHQTSTSGRWGDYSAFSIDPSDNATFWLAHEYYSTTSSTGWSTRLGNFKMAPAVPTPQLVADTATVTADNCNSNGVIDPNETVTVKFGIKNTGSANTTNLVATLQATGGVTSPSGPQNYGVVVAGGATVAQSFTFTAGNLACGSGLVATLQLQDGATNFGTVTYNFTTGLLSSSLYSTGNISVAIPDNTPAGVDIPLTVADVMTLSDVNVSFRLNHTFDGDLIISLVHPDNTVVTLVNRRGDSGANFGSGANDSTGTPTVIDDQATVAISAGTAPFVGSFTPETPLSALNGKPSNGTWKLRVSDNAAIDTGTVGSFKLELNRRLTCCGVTIAAAPPAVITAEDFTPANNAPDPGETVTVNLPLVNTGGSNTANLVGTLQATGGVTNPSGPQNYGVVVGGGPPVARSFKFTANGTCGSNITLSLALQDGANNLGTVTYTMRLGATTSVTTSFSNNTSITIPASGTGATTGAPATPYPSNIVVSGLSGTISKVTVALNGMNHTFPDDVDVLLVGPTGAKFIIMSDVGGSNAFVNATFTLDDNAAALMSDAGANPTGTYRPTNIGATDAFPSPAPASPYQNPATAGTATFASVFNGTNPNGTWSLYVVDDASVDVGTMTGGWTINITTAATVCSLVGPPAITNGPPPSPVIVGAPYTFNFTASGNPPPTFSVTGGLLPPGLGLSAGGVLSGPATSGGTGSFPNITVTATNGVAPNATQTFTLTTATRAANYIASFGLSGSDAVLTYDYDHDGLANLLEYGLGLDPTIAGLTGLPTVILKDYSGTQYLSMTFLRSSLATDLTYIVQGSDDLTTWTDLGTSIAGGATTGAGFVGETGSAPNFTVEVRDTVPYDPITPNKRFLRLKITSP